MQQVEFSFSLTVPCEGVARELLTTAINGPEDENYTLADSAPAKAFLRQHFGSDDPDAHRTGAVAETQPGGVHVWASDWDNLGVITAAIRRFSPAALPLGFTYIKSVRTPCGKDDVAGYILITADSYLVLR